MSAACASHDILSVRQRTHDNAASQTHIDNRTKAQVSVRWRTDSRMHMSSMQYQVMPISAGSIGGITWPENNDRRNGLLIKQPGDWFGRAVNRSIGKLRESLRTLRCYNLRKGDIKCH